MQKTAHDNNIFIRRATDEDIPSILELLEYILQLHHSGRPDIFKSEDSKYSEEELKSILKNDKTPVFVAVVNKDSDRNTDYKSTVLGYAFCIEKEIQENASLLHRKYLYLDDICVSEKCRGKGVGGRLMDAVKEYCMKIGASSLELNVWGFNKSAISFYEHLGFKTQKSIMEVKI